MGGHTSCIAIEGTDGRRLVLDAGTGFRRIARDLGDEPLRGSVLLTHLHWDHVQGLPFLPNADREDAEVDLYVPRWGTMSALDLLARAMGPPHFPIAPDGLRGHWTVQSLDPGRHRIEGFDVTVAEVAHKGGRTYGFRVSDGRTTIAYVPDHAPTLATPTELDAARQLVAGVDLLLHDAQFLDEERSLADAYGHSTLSDAIDLAAVAECETLVLVHHAPDRSDDQVEVLAALAKTRRVEVVLGREGQRFVLGEGYVNTQTA